MRNRLAPRSATSRSRRIARDVSLAEAFYVGIDAYACRHLVLSTADRIGERVLRAQLCRTPEWQDDETRNAAAAHADAAGLSALAAVLRGRNSPALRKRDFFKLCRFWSLRSDVWRRSPVAALSAAPPHPPAAAADVAALAATRELANSVASYKACLESGMVLSASRAEPLAPVATFHLQVCDGVGLLAAGAPRVAGLRNTDSPTDSDPTPPTLRPRG